MQSSMNGSRCLHEELIIYNLQCQVERFFMFPLWLNCWYSSLLDSQVYIKVTNAILTVSILYGYLMGLCIFFVWDPMFSYCQYYVTNDVDSFNWTVQVLKEDFVKCHIRSHMLSFLGSIKSLNHSKSRYAKVRILLFGNN